MPLTSNDNTLLLSLLTQNTKVWRPLRTLVKQPSDSEQKLEILRRSPKTIVSTGSGNKVVSAGLPKQLKSIQATENPSKQVDRTFSQVVISFTRDGNDSAYSGTRVWFSGYKGNPSPVLMCDGVDSPITLLCETTGESVTVTGQPFNSAHQVADFNSAKTCALLLDGVISAPPAPTIAQNTVTVTVGGSTAGQQFQFNMIPASFVDVVAGYWIYRVGSHSAPTPPASRYKWVLHNNTAQGIYTFQDLSGVSTNFYYVSAVNQSGLESSLTDATPGGGGGSGTNTTYRPTTGTQVAATWTNLANAWDGNSTTYASGNSGLGGSAQATWQAFPAIVGSPTSVVLNVTYSNVIGSHGSVSHQYSVNNGSSYSTLSGTSATLSNAVDLTQLKIRSTINGGDYVNSKGFEILTTTTEKMNEIWVVVTT